MFRTISVKLSYERSLVETAVAFNKACQIVIDYGSKNKTYNKYVLNKATYFSIRKSIPNLTSTLVQTARDQASEMLKRTKFTKCVKKRLTVRYDKRSFKFYPNSNYVSLSTVQGRLNFSFKHHKWLDKWKGEYTNAQLVIHKHKIFLNVQVKLPDISLNSSGNVLGIDRGILNIASCSDNTFYSSKHLRQIKGKYQHLKRKLQHIGTRSAHRKLQRLSKRERRFVLNTNHCIAKSIVNKPFDVFALEKLQIKRSKKFHKSKKFRKMLGSWSPSQLQTLIEYKAQNLGKMVVYVNPYKTSQRCSKCGYTHSWNRHSLKFHCGNCGLDLNADLNASRNIACLGKSEISRLCVIQPNVVLDETVLMGITDNNYKPIGK